MTVEEFHQQRYAEQQAQAHTKEEERGEEEAKKEEEEDEDSEEVVKKAREWDEFKDGLFSVSFHAHLSTF